MKNIFVFLTVIILFASCERNYDISGVKELKPQPVVEGYIENGVQPYVILTNTFSVFGNLSASNLSNIFIHGATVTVTGGGKTFNLVEVPITIGTSKLYVYGDINSGDTGVLNTAYNLNIKLADGTIITSQTTIGALPVIDSMWGVPRNETPTDSFVRMYIRRHDNGSTKDFFRYFTKTNTQQYFPGNVQGLLSVFNDQYTNGLTYDWPVNRGIDRNDTSKNQFKHPLYFIKGDTVTFKLCAIDQQVYDFWLTADNSYGNVGNPFASPSNLKSNVNGALGVWCGYAAFYMPSKKKGFFIPK